MFETFFLANIGKENVFHDILEQQKAFLGYKNKEFKKTKNLHFSKRVNPSNPSKNGHFSKVFFLGNIGHENIFHDILERKNSFLGYKNKKLKKSKIDIFRKWSTHCFGPKMTIIPTGFFKQ